MKKLAELSISRKSTGVVPEKSPTGGSIASHAFTGDCKCRCANCKCNCYCSQCKNC